MTITIFAVGHRSNPYEVEMERPTIHDLAHKDSLQGRLISFDRKGPKWQEVIQLVLTKTDMVTVAGHAYKFDSLNADTGEFKLKAG